MPAWIRVHFCVAVLIFCLPFLLQAQILDYNQITLADIQKASLSSGKINGSNNSQNQLLTGTILVYQTSEGRYGKMQINQYGYDLYFKWLTYNANGTTYSSGNNLKIPGTRTCDLDLGRETESSSDFWWQQVNAVERYLVPERGARFAVFQARRDTVIFAKRDLSDTMIPFIFQGFNIKLNSGAGEGQILFGDNAHGLGIEDLYIDVPDFVKQDWQTLWIAIHMYLNQMNSKDLSYAWSSEKGGCLKLTVTFEEDGHEILGAWHGDIWDAELIIYIIPFIDNYQCLHWKVEAEFNFSWEIYGIPESWFISKSDLQEKLEKGICYSLSNSIDQLMLSLLFFGGLKSNAAARYYQATIIDDRAMFVLLPLSPPRLVRDLLVLFDHIEVHDDEDPFGSGELHFKGEVNGISTEWSDEISASSGSTIYLTGAQWQRRASLVSEQNLTIHFEGYDGDEPDADDSLGKIDLTFGPPNWGVQYNIQKIKSSNGDFTLHYWIVDAGTPTGYKRLQVKFDRIDLNDDEDPYGSGELFFSGIMNGQETGKSGQFDRDSGTKIYLGGKGCWEKTVYVPENGSLRIHFSGYDDDWPDSDDSLGEINLAYTQADNWGIGCNQRASSNNDFVLHYRIKDLDAKPAADEELFIVTFRKIEVHNDEDNAGSGELFFYGAVNCDYTSLSNQMDLNSGSSRELVGGNWFKRVRVRVYNGANIHIFFTGYDADVTTAESLGDIFVTHSAQDNWGVDQSHRVRSSNGDFTLTYTVERPYVTK
ncbi:MAG: hypothetical protein ONB32_03045 [candidate division KSB1 bacterium]|nr:hypothetical protein [candidate division KSB1 bacterium]